MSENQLSLICSMSFFYAATAIKVIMYKHLITTIKTTINYNYIFFLAIIYHFTHVFKIKYIHLQHTITINLRIIIKSTTYNT